MMKIIKQLTLNGEPNNLSSYNLLIIFIRYILGGSKPRKKVNPLTMKVEIFAGSHRKERSGKLCAKSFDS